jgi:CRISPR-associated protein Csx17
MAVQHLDGCTPEPLMGSLKALGVLRIVAEQADDGVRGGWSDGVFVLESNHDRIGLVDFFLEGYAPTPIIAPWAGGSGFFGADNRVALDMISGSESSRLTGFSHFLHYLGPVATTGGSTSRRTTCSGSFL